MSPTTRLKALLEDDRSKHLSEVRVINKLGHPATARTRPLSNTEQHQLEAQGNRCLPGTTWDNVLVLVSAGSAFDPTTIHSSHFGGTCLLGSYSGMSLRSQQVDGVTLPGGIYNSTIVNCAVCNGAHVSRTNLLSRCIVGEGATIVGCGSVCMKAKQCSFSNGRSLALAIEIGGRDLAIYAEMSLEEAAVIVGDRSNVEVLEAWTALVGQYAERARSEYTLICARAVLLNCPRIEDACIGAGALIEGSVVVDSTVLSGTSRTCVRGGSLVEHSIVQWGCECESMAIVSGSFMCAASHVEKHAKLIDSVLGTGSGAAEGEITSSLVGPFVGFHHQALLIACYWPAGRGNIGYGANVGSNHTGKAPDQEIWPGEGVFFGLATSLKFPFNCARAPYSLIATGVVALPQRLEMPFSLINSPGEVIAGMSPALNEIMPGWILSDNLYMMLRGETKFRKRGASARSLEADEGRIDYEWEAIRPATVTMMIEARRRLLDVDPDPQKCRLRDSRGGAVFTDSQIPGLGKNYLKDGARLRGIKAYSDFIEFYSLRALWRAVQAGASPSDIFQGSARSGNFTFEPTATVVRPGGYSGQHAIDEWYGFARPLLMDEKAGTQLADRLTLKHALSRYSEVQKLIADGVLRSKQKDDQRGPLVIDGYAEAHGSAETSDPVVKKVMAETHELQEAIQEYIGKLDGVFPSSRL